MRTLLENAIENRCLVHLIYDGRARTVEPYFVGADEDNRDVLLARQVSPWVPSRESWQIFLLDNIFGLLVHDRKFTALKEGHTPPTQMLTKLRLVV